jgi:hypothetical protein
MARGIRGSIPELTNEDVAGREEEDALAPGKALCDDVEAKVDGGCKDDGGLSGQRALEGLRPRCGWDPHAEVNSRE